MSRRSIERMAEAPRAELRLKAAVIDRLFGGNHVDDDSAHVPIHADDVSAHAANRDLAIALGPSS